jgi:hypothetical protein
MSEAGTKSPKKSSASVTECANCGESAASLLACARCKLVSYCGKACQIQHWKAHFGHKALCVSTKDREPAAQAPTSSAAELGDKCSICLETITSGACVLQCSHSFHDACVSGIRNYGISQVCPLCRLPLSGATKEFYEKAQRLFVLKNRLDKEGFLSPAERVELTICENAYSLSRGDHEMKLGRANQLGTVACLEKYRRKIRDGGPDQDGFDKAWYGASGTMRRWALHLRKEGTLVCPEKYR